MKVMEWKKYVSVLLAMCVALTIVSCAAPPEGESSDVETTSGVATDPTDSASSDALTDESGNGAEEPTGEDTSGTHPLPESSEGTVASSDAVAEGDPTQASTDNNGTSVQDPDEGSSVQDPDEGSSAQDPDEGSSVQDPDEGSSAQDPDEGSSVQGPGEGSSAQGPGEGSSAQDPDEESSAQDPDEGSSVQGPGEGSSAQDPDEGSEKEPESTNPPPEETTDREWSPWY